MIRETAEAALAEDTALTLAAQGGDVAAPACCSNAIVRACARWH